MAADLKIEICILAGGLSTRFGRDKARLRFGRRTMLSIVRHTALGLDVPVRVIRRDRVPRCGPLGGILTALQTTRAAAVLFLACDMPLVTATILRRIVRASVHGTVAVFAEQDGRVGFPYVLPRDSLSVVDAQVARREFSLHRLATVLKAKTLNIHPRGRVLLNVNTPADAMEVARFLN